MAEALAASGRASVDDLVPTVYADVPEDRHRVARCSLWAHLRKLGSDGRAASEDPDDIEARWEPT